MTYTYINNTAAYGNLDYFLVYLSSNVPIFPVIILMFVGFGVLMATYYGTKRFSGEPSFLSSAVAGAMTQSMVALIMSMTTGIISTTQLIGSFAITIIVLIFYLFPENR